MPDIPYRISRFTGGWPLNGSATLAVSWEELVWAAILVGKPDLNSVLQFGRESLLEACWRACLVRANLREDPNGFFVRSDAFQALDPTEKGAVTYFLGMAVAKVFADRLLNVPFLRHVRALVDSNVIQLSSKKSPDLAGPRSQDEWLIAEAKGRTRTVASGVMEAAKKQARSVVSVNGNPPWLVVATGMGLSKRLEFQMQDPEPARKGTTAKVSEEAWFRAYYEPVIAAIKLRSVEASPDDQARISLPLADLSILLPGKLRLLLESDGPLTRNNVLATIPHGEVETSTITPARIPRDGITIEFGESWSTTPSLKAAKYRREN